MENILANFDSSESGTITTTNGEIIKNSAAQEKDAMKILLEGLDAGARKVNPLPGTHKMAKATATKHPASKHFVGASAENEPAPNAEQLDEVVDDRALMRDIQQHFPNDDMSVIQEWMASAEEFGQQLTVAEYATAPLLSYM